MIATVIMRVNFDDGWWAEQENQSKADILLGMAQTALGFRGRIERLSVRHPSGGETIIARPPKASKLK